MKSNAFREKSNMENLGIFSAASDNYPHTHIFGYESKTWREVWKVSLRVVSIDDLGGWRMLRIGGGRTKQKLQRKKKSF